VPFIRHIYKRANSATELASTCFRDISIDYSQEKEDSIEYRRDKLSAALDLANDSILCAVDRVDQINGWLAVAKANVALSADSSVVLEAYISAIAIAVPQPESTDNDLTSAIPLECFIHAGKLFVNSVRFKEGYSTIINACRTYVSSALLLLLGICSIRLGRFVDAEDALKEANLLDNRNPDVWAYLSLLCLTNGSNRYDEAERCLRQGLRLGLNNSVLLRELATSYMSIDKLSTAEEIIRRAISLEISASNVNKANPVTRKLFADVLAGQNQAILAVDEYQSIISEELTDNATKLAAAKSCLPLLHSLGRYEELKTLRKIIDTLKD
jgi:tetratricopeptide (TPR) repeat protein